MNLHHNSSTIIFFDVDVKMSDSDSEWPEHRYWRQIEQMKLYDQRERYRQQYAADEQYYHSTPYNTQVDPLRNPYNQYSAYNDHQHYDERNLFMNQPTKYQVPSYYYKDYASGSRNGVLDSPHNFDTQYTGNTSSYVRRLSDHVNEGFNNLSYPPKEHIMTYRNISIPGTSMTYALPNRPTTTVDKVITFILMVIAVIAFYQHAIAWYKAKKNTSLQSSNTSSDVHIARVENANNSVLNAPTTPVTQPVA